MVPVLSSSSVSTSPAASTARPDMASTLKRTSRSMPAMPMADNSAPMVVGMSVTKSATSTMTEMLASGIGREARNAGDGEDEDDRHACEKDVQRDLVRRLFAFRAFDKGDHSVEEGRALARCDANHDPVRDDKRAARHRRAVAARLADHRSGLAGDRGFVHGGNTLDHIAIRWDQIARLDEDDVAGLQSHRGHKVVALAVFRIRKLLGDDIRFRGPKAGGLGLAAPLGDGFREIRKQNREPEPEDDLEREAVVAGAGYEVADEKHRREKRRRSPPRT